MNWLEVDDGDDDPGEGYSDASGDDDEDSILRGGTDDAKD